MKHPKEIKKISFTQHLQGQPCFHKHHYRGQFQSQLHFYVSFISPYNFYVHRLWSAINIEYKNGLQCYICKVNLARFFLTEFILKVSHLLCRPLGVLVFC